MKKYFFVTGLLLLLTHIFVFFLYGKAEYAAGSYIALFFAALYIAYFKYAPKITKKSVKAIINIILILYSVFVYFWFAVYGFYMAVNFPKEGQFEEKLFLPASNEINEKNYYLFAEKLNGFHGKYDAQKLFDFKVGDNITLYEIDGEMENLLNITRRDRKEIIDFMSKNEIYLPQKEISSFSVLPKYLTVLYLFKLELIEINGLIQKDNFVLAEENYYKLWRAAEFMNRPPQEQISFLTAVSCVNLLCDFYFDAELKLTNKKEEIAEKAGSVFNLMDQSASSAMAYDYAFIKKNLADFSIKDLREHEHMIGAADDYIFIFSSAEWQHSRWPFYDYYKTLREFHEIYCKTASLFQKPYYVLNGDLKEYENLIKKARKGSLFINPVGSDLLKMSAPDFSGLILRKEAIKSKLNLFIYALTYSKSALRQNPPLDNLTGKSYLVKEKEGFLIVKSRFDSLDSLNEVKYKFKK